MYNYISLAHNNGIPISYKLENKTIKNYFLNKENNHIRIEYMNGRVEKIPLSETSLAEVKQNQEEDFQIIKRKVKTKSGILNGIKFTFIGIDAFLSIANFTTGNILGGVAFTLLGTSLSLNKPSSKAYSEMQLVSWLLKNSNQVDAMIREDVESFNKDNNNINYKYPGIEVIYPQEMYEEGINLNNLENLTVKQLRLIKRKTKQREKQLKNK